jgi:hypothetical protein
MRPITFIEFREAAGLDNQRLKVLRYRRQCVGAFGRDAAYEALGYLDLDLVAMRLLDVLSEKMDRTLAAELVRDQWGVWMRVAAVAETTALPSFWFIVEYETPSGKRWHLTLGSQLDSRSEVSLRRIAEDLHKRAGVIAKSYVVVEMQSVLDDVRKAAKKAKVLISERFLPPANSPELEALLKPFGDAPDRAIIITDNKTKAEAADKARRSGILARATVEAGLPSERGR